MSKNDRIWRRPSGNVRAEAAQPWQMINTWSVLADRVLDIVSFDGTQIQPVPKIAQTSEVEFLSGLVTIENTMIALIDLPNLFSSKTDADLAAVTAAAVGSVSNSRSILNIV